jgi:hypothetical protein
MKWTGEPRIVTTWMTFEREKRMTLMTDEKQICPVCGQAQANTDLETNTNEQELRCRNKDCGFFASAEIHTDDDGRHYWVETTWFPMSADGRVRRRILDKKNKREQSKLAGLPKHICAKSGNPSFGFAPLDFDPMKQLVERNASKEEIGAQVHTSIEADATKNPNPTEPVFERFKAALVRNIPFAVYCRACLELVCLIHPHEMTEEEQP